MRKQIIKNSLIKFFVQEDIFDKSALLLIEEIPKSDSQELLAQLKFQLGLEKMKMEKEKDERLERMRMEQEREKMTIGKEREEREHECRLKQLQIQGQAGPHFNFRPPPTFDVTKHIRLVHPFQEKEVDQ